MSENEKGTDVDNDPNDTWFNFDEFEIDGVKHLVVIVSDAGSNPRYYPVPQFFPNAETLAQLDRAIVEPED